MKGNDLVLDGKQHCLEADGRRALEMYIVPCLSLCLEASCSVVTSGVFFRNRGATAVGFQTASQARCALPKTGRK